MKNALEIAENEIEDLRSSNTNVRLNNNVLEKEALEYFVKADEERVDATSTIMELKSKISKLEKDNKEIVNMFDELESKLIKSNKPDKEVQVVEKEIKVQVEKFHKENSRGSELWRNYLRNYRLYLFQLSFYARVQVVQWITILSELYPTTIIGPKTRG